MERDEPVWLPRVCKCVGTRHGHSRISPVLRRTQHVPWVGWQPSGAVVCLPLKLAFKIYNSAFCLLIIAVSRRQILVNITPTHLVTLTPMHLVHITSTHLVNITPTHLVNITPNAVWPDWRGAVPVAPSWPDTRCTSRHWVFPRGVRRRTDLWPAWSNGSCAM